MINVEDLKGIGLNFVFKPFLVNNSSENLSVKVFVKCSVDWMINLSDLRETEANFVFGPFRQKSNQGN